MALPDGYKPFDPNASASSSMPAGYKPYDPNGSTQPTANGGSTPLDVGLALFNEVNSMTPWARANQFLKDKVGGGIAEAGGYLGAKAGYPETGQALGVAVGGAVSLAPEAIAAYSGLKGIYDSNNPIVKGLVNTPKELGPQYAAQNDAIGISNKVPETAPSVKYQNPYEYSSQLQQPVYKNGVAGLPDTPRAFPKPRLQYPADSGIGAAQPLPSTIPMKYPDDVGALINQADSRVTQFGSKLSPQELSDYHQLIGTKIATGEIPKIDPTTGKTTPIFAKASRIQGMLSRTLNQVAEPLLQNADLPEGVMPTRQGLNQANSIANKQQAIVEFLKRNAVRGTEGAMGALGVKSLYDYLRK